LLPKLFGEVDMSRLASVAQHLSVEEVNKKIKGTVGFWRVQKWLVIHNLLVAPRPLREIALHLGLGWQTVRNLVSQYNRLGPEAIEGPGKGGRRRAYMSVEEEVQFLAPFFERAGTGKVATAMEIKRALEQHLGHPVHKTTVYRLLGRHSWRKVVPRPFHKKAKKKEQEEFKKNSLTR
jgi:transposase